MRDHAHECRDQPSWTPKQLAAAVAKGVLLLDPVAATTNAVIMAATALYGDQREDTGTNAAPVLELAGVADGEDPIGEEVRVIDNGNSGAGLTRQITATREWRRTVTIGSVTTVSGSAGIDGAGLKASVEAAIRKDYSEATETKHVFSETTTISVLPRASVRVVLRWKELLRSGVVRVTEPDGSVHEVPFRVVTGVTFDQKTEDLTAQ